jgi:pimeloyl-ACP methyl ester carboxylesterase
LRVDEHTIEVAGTPVFYRSAPVPTGLATPLYLHGAPTSSDDWTQLLQRTGGIAPDLIGFGRSGKGGHLEFTVAGLAAFVERLLEELETGRVALIGHDLGAAAGLELARRRPELFERIMIVNPAPFLCGSRIAGLFRRPVLGELIMGSTTRWMLARALRRGGFPAERVDSVWEQFDQGTQRAILKLYRSGGLAAAPEWLELRALVLCGERDPWLPTESRASDASVVRVDAGHWPWLERAEVADQIAGFARG